MTSQENTSDTSNRIIRNSLSKNTASDVPEVNVPGVNAESKQPVYRGMKLLSISTLFEEIFERPSFGKRTRSQYYNVIHAFREAFPSEQEPRVTLTERSPRASDSAIRRMNSPEMSNLIAPALLTKIEQLSTPDTYQHVRRANRNRVHGQQPLSEDGLNRLSAEIRAAMIWRQLNDFNEKTAR